MSIKSDYLNIDSALKRVGGNETLYKKLLTHFLNDNHVDVLNEAVEKGDYEIAAQNAHTIKGVSANLSLDNLRQMAADIEAQLKSGQDATALLSELNATFDKTIEYINEYIG